MSKKVMQQALDALDQLTDKMDGTRHAECGEFGDALAAIEALRIELAKPEPVPVAWITTKALAKLHDFDATAYGREFEGAIPLYTKEQA